MSQSRKTENTTLLTSDQTNYGSYGIINEIFGDCLASSEDEAEESESESTTYKITQALYAIETAEKKHGDTLKSIDRKLKILLGLAVAGMFGGLFGNVLLLAFMLYEGMKLYNKNREVYLPLLEAANKQLEQDGQYKTYYQNALASAQYYYNQLIDSFTMPADENCNKWEVSNGWYTIQEYFKDYVLGDYCFFEKHTHPKPNCQESALKLCSTELELNSYQNNLDGILASEKNTTQLKNDFINILAKPPLEPFSATVFFSMLGISLLMGVILIYKITSTHQKNVKLKKSNILDDLESEVLTMLKDDLRIKLDNHTPASIKKTLKQYKSIAQETDQIKGTNKKKIRQNINTLFDTQKVQVQDDTLVVLDMKKIKKKYMPSAINN